MFLRSYQDRSGDDDKPLRCNDSQLNEVLIEHSSYTLRPFQEEKMMPICPNCGNYFTRRDLGCPRCNDSGIMKKTSNKIDDGHKYSIIDMITRYQALSIKVGIVSLVGELEESIVDWFPNTFEDNYLLTTGGQAGSSILELKLSSGKSLNVRIVILLVTRTPRFRDGKMIEIFFKGIKFLLIFIGNEITGREFKEILEIIKDAKKAARVAPHHTFHVILVTWNEPLIKNNVDSTKEGKPFRRLLPSEFTTVFDDLTRKSHESRPEMSVLVVQKHLSMLNEVTFNELIREVTSEWLSSLIE